MQDVIPVFLCCASPSVYWPNQARLNFIRQIRAPIFTFVLYFVAISSWNSFLFSNFQVFRFFMTESCWYFLPKTHAWSWFRRPLGSGCRWGIKLKLCGTLSNSLSIGIWKRFHSNFKEKNFSMLYLSAIHLFVCLKRQKMIVLSIV